MLTSILCDEDEGRKEGKHKTNKKREAQRERRRKGRKWINGKERGRKEKEGREETVSMMFAASWSPQGISPRVSRAGHLIGHKQINTINKTNEPCVLLSSCPTLQRRRFLHKSEQHGVEYSAGMLSLDLGGLAAWTFKLTTIASMSLERGDLPIAAARKLPGRPPIPHPALHAGRAWPRQLGPLLHDVPPEPSAQREKALVAARLRANTNPSSGSNWPSQNVAPPS